MELTGSMLSTGFQFFVIIVFGYIAYLLIRLLQHQQIATIAPMNQSATVAPMELQAYERLILFVERIGLGSLVLRLAEPNMSSTQLKNVMLLSVQQEYEHNITQQIYVSKQLWEMVELLMNQTMSVIDSAHEGDEQPMDDYKGKLLSVSEGLAHTFGQKVKDAIRGEVKNHLI